MCPFGDINNVPDFWYGKYGFVIVGSSFAICPFSKNVIHMSPAGSCVELQSEMHHQTDQPTNRPLNQCQAKLTLTLQVEQYTS